MNDRWNELSLRDKADLMRVFIKSGVRDLPTMRSQYNSYAEGGPYTVVKGDTLSGIASKNNMSLQDIINLNPNIKNPNIINIGDQINLKAVEQVPVPEPEPEFIPFERPKTMFEAMGVEAPEGVKVSLDSNPFLDLTRTRNEAQKAKMQRLAEYPKYNKPEPVYQPTSESTDARENMRAKYAEMPVSRLYRQVTGKDWSNVKNDSNFIYDGSLQGNLKIKDQLIEQQLKKSNFTFDNNATFQNNDIGEVKNPGIDNPAGLDYSSVSTVPLDTSRQGQTDLSKAFTFSSPKEFKCVGNQCASQVTKTGLSRGGGSLVDKYDFRGDAWTWLGNAEKKGFTTINMYDDSSVFKDKKNMNKQSVIRLSTKYSQNPEFKEKIKESISPGNVVTLLYPRSPNFEKAREESKGKTLSTHVGVIADISGKTYVVDNSGGHLHYRDIDTVLNGKDSDGVVITGMVDYRDKKNSEGMTADLSKWGMHYSPELIRTNRIGNIASYRAMTSLDKNAATLQEKFGVSPESLALTQKLLIPLMYQESMNGVKEGNKAYNATTRNRTFVDDALADIRENVLPEGGIKIPVINKTIRGGISESIGLTNVKLKDENHFFSDEEIQMLGLDKDIPMEQQESPELTAVLTAVKIDKMKRRLDSELGDIKGRVPENVYNSLLITAWNQGFGNISTNIRRAKDSGDIKKELVDNYSSTKYADNVKTWAKYLGVEIL